MFLHFLIWIIDQPLTNFTIPRCSMVLEYWPTLQKLPSFVGKYSIHGLVGGLEHCFFVHIGNNDPNWRTPSFFRGLGRTNHQPVEHRSTVLRELRRTSRPFARKTEACGTRSCDHHADCVIGASGFPGTPVASPDVPADHPGYCARIYIIYT